MTAPDTFTLLLWLLGIPVGILLTIGIAWGLEWVVWQFGTGVDRCQDFLGDWRTAAHRGRHHRKDQRAFLYWLRERSGSTSSQSGVDERLVEAQRQGELVKSLVEDEIPEAILRCVNTHRMFAQVSGAFHMAEIAWEPECQQSRAFSLWLLTHAVDLLENYPLRMEDARLLHNSVVLRKRALPTCRRCPFIGLAVDQAPHLCPTAELVQVQGAPS